MRLAGYRAAAVAVAISSLLGTVGCRRHLLRPRGDAAAVVVVAPSADRPKKAAPELMELEPNDNPAQAQVLVIDPQWPVVSVAGVLAGAGKDVDVFKLALPAPAGDTGTGVSPGDSGVAEDPRRQARRLAVEITSTGSTSISAQLLDEGGRVLESVSVEPGDSAGMPNLAIVPGHTYFLRMMVRGKRTKTAETAPAECTYKVTVELGDFELAEEREPNDAIETATPVMMAGTAEIAGFHGWLRDQDFYRVTASEGPAALDVSVDAVEGVSAGLQVMSASGARLATGKGRQGESLALRNVSIPSGAGESGSAVFFIVVRAESGQNRGQRYVLHMSLGAAKSDAEIEPNDSAANATVVHDGVITGYLPAGDVDYFRYQADGERDVDISVTWPRKIRGKIDVIRPENAGATQGNQPANQGLLASAEANKARQTLSLPKVQAGSAGLLIRLSPLKGDGNAHEPYTLSFTSAPPAIPQKGTTN
jgi:hypothetical protein